MERRNGAVSQSAEVCPFLCPDGEIGRRSGLKIRRPQGHRGSSPLPGTNKTNDLDENGRLAEGGHFRLVAVLVAVDHIGVFTCGSARYPDGFRGAQLTDSSVWLLHLNVRFLRVWGLTSVQAVRR